MEHKTALAASRSRRGVSARSDRGVPFKVIFIVGPTASGKTALGIWLAKKLNGEIINADARQVYRYFTIGTGKPLDGKSVRYEGRHTYLVQNVPHHLMDFLSPREAYTVAGWRKQSLKVIKEITKRGHVPIVVGGTGLYIQSLVDNYQIPSVAPQEHFRKAMESKSLDELITLLRQLDPDAMNIVDVKNRRRVIRAIEVVTFTGKPFSAQRVRSAPIVDALLIGVQRTKEELHERIEKTVQQMIDGGWADEIRMIHKKGYAWDVPAMSSIGYREMAAYIRGECTLDEARAKLLRATKQYAKRQMTWFKRDGRIHWVKNEQEAIKIVKKWI